MINPWGNIETIQQGFEARAATEENLLHAFLLPTILIECLRRNGQKPAPRFDHIVKLLQKSFKMMLPG
jgi:hypothetical protein